jgi:hypothetical protein
MNLKNIFIATAVLLLASAAVYLVRRPAAPASADARIGASLVDANTLAKAMGLRLSDQGKTVLVERQADGSWAVSSYHGIAADFQKLSQFVDELERAKIDRFISARKDRVERLEFKDTRVALLDASGKELWSLTLGKNTEGGGRAVRFGAEDKAYLSRASLWLDAESKNWADTTLLSLKPEDIASVELGFAGAPALAVKRAKKEDPFAPEKTPEAGRTFKADKISSLLGSLGSLRFSDTTATDDAGALEARKSSRTITLTTFDGKKIGVTLARKPEQKIVKPAAAASPKPADPAKPGAAEPAPAPAADTTETLPAGPVFVSISHSDAKAPVNALMAKRAYQISEYTFTGLPQKPDELFETPPPPAPAPAATPAAPAPAKTP